MSTDPYIGEIAMFAGNFAPRGWALCDGQLLSISSNTALFSVLGTTYGGDGKSTFALPDLRGRLPMHAGSGPGLTPRRLGERAGAETVALTTAQIPAHGHTVGCSNAIGDAADPTGHLPAKASAPNDVGVKSYAGAATGKMAAGMVDPSGGGQAHDNMPPFHCINYIIALQGVFPSRS